MLKIYDFTGFILGIHAEFKSMRQNSNYILFYCIATVPNVDNGVHTVPASWIQRWDSGMPHKETNCNLGSIYLTF